MPHRSIRSVEIAHATSGRLRLRLRWLHDDPAPAETIADAVAAIDGVEDVQVRAWTGSVLCRFDPERIAGDRIVAAVRAVSSAEATSASAAPDRRRLARIARQGTGVTHAAAALFKGLDADVLRATDGRLDLADTAALGMVAVSVAKVATARTLPLPSWFDLLWYAYTVFMRAERSAIDHTPHPLAAAPRRSGPAEGDRGPRPGAAT